MGHLRTDVVGMFNSFLDEQRKLEGDCRFTFTRFSDRPQLIENGSSFESAKPLSVESYNPVGYTALLDAIATTIKRIDERVYDAPPPRRPKPLVAIITDGQENASTEYAGDAGAKRVREMIKQREHDGWQFVFLAANMDSVTAGNAQMNYFVSTLGSTRGHTISYSPWKSALMGQSLNAVSTAYRTAGAAGQSLACAVDDQLKKLGAGTHHADNAGTSNA